jgi:hypothetical protein
MARFCLLVCVRSCLVGNCGTILFREPHATTLAASISETLKVGNGHGCNAAKGDDVLACVVVGRHLKAGRTVVKYPSWPDPAAVV